MRSRDVTIPLVLWICAAICAHFLFGTGGSSSARCRTTAPSCGSSRARRATSPGRTARRSRSRWASRARRRRTTSRRRRPRRRRKPEDQPKPTPTADEEAAEKSRRSPRRSRRKRRRSSSSRRRRRRSPSVLPEDPLKDRRIAVRQHAKPDQEDNPNAHFIADEANHVEKETRGDADVARPRRREPDARRQPPGQRARRRATAEKTRIAESEEHKGEKNRAPGEKGTDFDVMHEPKIPKPEPQPTPAAAPRRRSRSRRREPTTNPPRPRRRPRSRRSRSRRRAARRPRRPRCRRRPTATWTFNPARPGGAPGTTPAPTRGRSEPRAARRQALVAARASARSARAGHDEHEPQRRAQVATIVGQDNLRKLREADGERRKSEHRGSWVASNFERWRSAIENYVSSVKPGNQTALNTAAVPFASYLNGMHNRIHPIFADSFLESLDGLPAEPPDERPAPGDAARDRPHEGRAPQEDGHRARRAASRRSTSPRSTRSTARSRSARRRAPSSRPTATCTCTGSSTATRSTRARPWARARSS